MNRFLLTLIRVASFCLVGFLVVIAFRSWDNPVRIESAPTPYRDRDLRDSRDPRDKKARAWEVAQEVLRNSDKQIDVASRTRLSAIKSFLTARQGRGKMFIDEIKAGKDIDLKFLRDAFEKRVFSMKELGDFLFQVLKDHVGELEEFDRDIAVKVRTELHARISHLSGLKSEEDFIRRYQNLREVITPKMEANMLSWGRAPVIFLLSTSDLLDIGLATSYAIYLQRGPKAEEQALEQLNLTLDVIGSLLTQGDDEQLTSLKKTNIFPRLEAHPELLKATIATVAHIRSQTNKQGSRDILSICDSSYRHLREDALHSLIEGRLFLNGNPAD